MMTALPHRVVHLLFFVSFQYSSYSQAFSTHHVHLGHSLAALRTARHDSATHLAQSLNNNIDSFPSSSSSMERRATAKLRSTVLDFPLEVIDSKHPRVETSKALFRRASDSISNFFGVDTEQVSRLGVGFGLSYAILSVINGSVTLSVAWYLSAKRTGLSPLIPGQWKSLLGAYGTLYAFVQILKPFRVAAAIAMANRSQKFLDQTQEKLNCSRRIAMAVQYTMGWMAWLVMSSMGICIASILSGTPIFGGIL